MREPEEQDDLQLRVVEVKATWSSLGPPWPNGNEARPPRRDKGRPPPKTVPFLNNAPSTFGLPGGRLRHGHRKMGRLGPSPSPGSTLPDGQCGINVSDGPILHWSMRALYAWHVACVQMRFEEEPV